jgi:amino acid permease
VTEKEQARIKKRNEDDPKIKRNRMGSFATFFAIIKAYTTMNIFFMPIGFKEGGWLFSPFALILACFFEAICAMKLCSAARLVSIYDYPDLVEYTFGKTVKMFF